MRSSRPAGGGAPAPTRAYARPPRASHQAPSPTLSPSAADHERPCSSSYARARAVATAAAAAAAAADRADDTRADGGGAPSGASMKSTA